MGVIFTFSAQTGDESSETSGAIVDVVLKVVVPNYDQLSEEEQLNTLDEVTFWVRKAGHFSEFAMLGFLLLNHFLIVTFSSEKYEDFSYFGKNIHVKKPGKTLPWRHAIHISLLIGILYAASDEIHQVFVDSRGPSVRDVGIDSSGVLLGILLCYLLFYVLVYRHYAYRRSER